MYSFRSTLYSIIIGKNAVIKGDVFFRHTLKTEEGADIDGYIKRLSNGKDKNDEELDIEEIKEKVEVAKKFRKPKIVPVHTKEAV